MVIRFLANALMCLFRVVVFALLTGSGCFAEGNVQKGELIITSGGYSCFGHYSTSMIYHRDGDVFKLYARSHKRNNSEEQPVPLGVPSFCPVSIPVTQVEELENAVAASRNCIIPHDGNSEKYLSEQESSELFTRLAKSSPKICAFLEQHRWRIESGDLEGAATRLRNIHRDMGSFFEIKANHRLEITVSGPAFTWSVSEYGKSWNSCSACIPKVVSKFFFPGSDRFYEVSGEGPMIDRIGTATVDRNASQLWRELTSEVPGATEFEATQAELETGTFDPNLIDVKLKVLAKDSVINQIVWHTTYADGKLAGSASDVVNAYNELEKVARKIVWLNRWKQVDSKFEVCTWIADKTALVTQGSKPFAICFGLKDVDTFVCYIYPSKHTDRAIVALPMHPGMRGALERLRSSPGFEVPPWLAVDGKEALRDGERMDVHNLGSSRYRIADYQNSTDDFKKYIEIRREFLVEDWSTSPVKMLRREPDFANGILLNRHDAPTAIQWTKLRKDYTDCRQSIESVESIQKWRLEDKKRFAFVCLEFSSLPYYESAQRTWHELGLEDRPTACVALGVGDKVYGYVFLSKVEDRAVVYMPVVPEIGRNPWWRFSMCAGKLHEGEVKLVDVAEGKTNCSAQLLVIDKKQLAGAMAGLAEGAFPDVKKYAYEFSY